ncbi:WbuC family cupin fold metalloprotein [Paracoccaceae bacterium]|nr:WbuC family cupin fold metalloprotein [Paracoccaceae bacterium]
MSLKVFDLEYLNVISSKAQLNPRSRQHQNIHESYEEPCQRLLNAIEPNSYIRPHRHSSHPCSELLFAARGSLVFLTFDNSGEISEVIHFGTNNHSKMVIGLEVTPDIWHTVVALETGCVLLEVKAGPFDPKNPKDLAKWAPSENDPAAKNYLDYLKSRIKENSLLK